MTTANRVIKNTGFLYAKTGITMFISLYTTRLILNALGVSDFGIFNIVGGAIAMLGFLNASMTSATQRFMSYAEGEGNKEKQKQIFNISIILHFCIALLLALGLLVAGYFFFNGVLNIPNSRVEAAKVVYTSLIISTVFTVMSVPYDAVLNARENMKYFSIVGIIESVLKLVVALAVVYLAGDKLMLYGIMMAVIPLIIMVILRTYCYRNYDECIVSPKKYWNKKLMKEMTSFAGWSLLGTLSGVFSQYGLSIVLNNFFGTILNAAQGIANQISGQLMVFSNTMLMAVNPIIAKSEGSGNSDNMIRTSLLGSKLAFYLLSLFAIPFIIEAPYILNIWLKNVPEWAVVFSRLQLIRSLIEQTTIMMGIAISAKGDIRAYLKVKSFLNILPIVLTTLFFYYHFPPYYLYVPWIIFGGIFGGAVSVYYAVIKCGLKAADFYKKVLIPCMGVAVIMVLTGTMMQYLFEASFVRLILVILGTSLTFFFSVYFVFLDKDEKVLVGTLLQFLKNKVKAQ